MNDIFYNSRHVRVSKTVVLIGADTYSTANITSVRVKETSLALRIFVGLFFGGFGALALSSQRFVLAFICLAIAGLAIVAKSKLFIATAGGERKALEESAGVCNQVRNAIVQAMQARG